MVTLKNLCAPSAFLERCEKAWDALCPSKDEDFTNVNDAGPHGSEADETEKNVCVQEAKEEGGEGGGGERM